MSYRQLLTMMSVVMVGGIAGCPTVMPNSGAGGSSTCASLESDFRQLGEEALPVGEACDECRDANGLDAECPACDEWNATALEMHGIFEQLQSKGCDVNSLSDVLSCTVQVCDEDTGECTMVPCESLEGP